MKYQPPYGPNWPDVPDPDGEYVNGNPALGIKGSVPPAQSIEYPMREVVHCIEKGGVVPADDDLFQLTRGVRRALYAWGIDTGSQNSLSVSLDPPLTSYGQGLEIRVLVASDNTGASTIRVNGLPTQQIVKKDGAQLYAGELRQQGIAVLVHDGSNFQLVSGAAGSTTIADGWFNGADYFVDVGTPNVIVGTPLIAPTAYAAGQMFAILVKNRNTGPTTINVNALGARDVVIPTDLPFFAGDIMPLQLIYVRYDGSKFIMLSPIHMPTIQSSLDFVVGPNPTPTPFFSDLYQAFEWLSRRRIGRSGYVTLTMQGQATGSPIVHTYNTDLYFDHPDGARVQIRGPGMNAIPQGSQFAVSGADTGSITANFNANMTMLRQYFQTEIRFPSGTAGLRLNNAAILLRDLLFTGSGYGGQTNQILIYAYNNATLSIHCVASCNSWSPWQVVGNSSISGIRFYSVGSGAQAGLVMSDMSSVQFGDPNVNVNEPFVIAQSLGMGVQAGHQTQLNVYTQQGPQVRGCQNGGIWMHGSSTFNLQWLLVWYTGNFGVMVTDGSQGRAVSGNVSNVPYQGWFASVNSSLDVPNSITAGVGQGDYVANHGSFIYAVGHTNSSAQFYPTKNTNSLGNSFIEA